MSEESKTWYRMTRPLFNSGFESDEFWAYGQDGFQEVLESFLGTDVEVYEKRIYVPPIPIRAIIQNVTSDIHSGTTMRQILCQIGTLKCGQYVRMNGDYWLVSGLPDNNKIYEKAVLWRCGYTIRMISPLTGTVVEYPIYDASGSQVGEEGTEQITIGASQHLVYLPYNEETIQIDHDFRFIMDKNRAHPTVYRVTQVDPISYSTGAENGLIRWTATETQLNEETDNKDEMVADYYGNVSAPIPPEGGEICLTDLDGDWVLTIGESKQISVSQNGEALKSYHAALDCEADTATIEQITGNVITVRAANDRTKTGSTIRITVTTDNGISVSSEILIANW